MSNLIPFTYHDTEIPVRLDVDGEPLWRATDIGKALDYKGDMGQHIRRLDDDERTLISNQGGSGEWWVNESGLYTLILGSRKREAKAFKRWITHEVVPAIRKTGKYEVSPLLDRHPDLKAITELAVGLAEARDIAAQAQAVAHAAEVKAARAEGKADMALDDRRMTIEEFVLRNGLLPQHPPATWKSIALWLTRFCLDYNLRVEKAPVVGKLWPDEWSYPLQAFGRWLDYDKRKPKQTPLHLVETEGVEYGLGTSCGDRRSCLG